MNTALAILLVIAAHVLRDGYPSLGKDKTFLARSVGAWLCLAGGVTIFESWQGAVLGLAIGLGFWADRKHAEGQRARDLRDALWLTYSGVTSVALFAAAAAYLINPWLALLVLIGLAKVPIWFATMRWLPSHQNRWAAAAFGAVVGAALAVCGT